MAFDIPEEILQAAIHLGGEFGRELAIGISGSQARGSTDAFSDADICVFVKGNYPSRETRHAAYSALGLGAPIYFDVDFNTSRGEGFIIEAIRCDFNWVVLENVRLFLSNLDRDFDCAEWLPGGLGIVKAIHDPGNVINKLQSQVPTYPIERSRHRVKQALKDAHYSLYKMRWLPKAAHRGDIFSFLKYQYLLLEKFFHAIFALNRIWFCDEKRLAERVMDFKYIPQETNQRIQSTILHTDGSQNLEGCLMEIKSLFRDTAACTHQIYPDLDLPTAWE